MYAAEEIKNNFYEIYICFVWLNIKNICIQILLFFIKGI
jgi:hypothetical protein